MKLKIFALICVTLTLFTRCEHSKAPFRIGSKIVEEGEYTARVISPTEMTSNYPMQLDTSIPQPILFKLSFNGRDNEAGFGQDHRLIVPAGITEFFAPLLKFGSQSPITPVAPSTINQATNVHFRVDLRPVLHAFAEQSFYITPTQDTIYAENFEGLYIAGGTAPLEWIWDTDGPHENLRFQDSDQDSIYELSVRFTPPTAGTEIREWTLSQDLSRLPKFSSPDAPILEALTNLALEEAIQDIRSDGAFSAGKEWGGVWTRDISYAAQLSLAYLFPENVKTSLRAKLSKSGRIIQDTGTGGAWPISSDRHVWTLAAWEVYLATGDGEWLDEIREPVIRALREDLLWNRDPVSGMLLGETSFEDWREQTYPAWMTPSDIHASQALSTNIIFKRALEIGLYLAKDNQDIIQSWPQLIQRFDQNIREHFWAPQLDAPASYIMANPSWVPASQRDLLGESLGILYLKSFSAIDTQLVTTYPRTVYGSPVISHQLPHVPAYHNKAVWPFVETYGLLAAKQVGNQQVYAHGFNSLIRSAALFLSHRENFQFTNGRPDETVINSDRQLWSVAGWVGAIYKGLFGIAVNYDFDRQGFDLELKPNNPFKWDRFSISDLNLHSTNISILLNGKGFVIASMTINGKQHVVDDPIPLLGDSLDIIVQLEEASAPTRAGMKLATYLLPETPVAQWSNDTLVWSSHWEKVILELNGLVIDTLQEHSSVMSDSLQGFFSLRSLDSLGQSSMPTEPYYLGPSATLVLSSKAPYFIELGKKNTFIEMNFSVASAGNYLIRFIYSNGSGPINTGNTCGLASLAINDWWLEQMISFPHTSSWDNFSTSSWARAQFKKGNNKITLSQDALPLSNMKGGPNLFRVVSAEIIPI